MNKFILGFAVLIPLLAAANDDKPDIARLIADNQLQISLTRQTPKSTIARQAVILQIEVATNRWFSRGTQINKFHLDNAVVLPFDGAAFNSSRMIDGVTWAIQSREITLYPLVQGDFNIPAIDVFVSVNTEEYGVVEGNWQSAPLSFYVSQPKQLALVDHYVVTEKFKVQIDSDFDRSASYQIGDSVTQTVKISAQQVPAMMLPELIDPDIEGINIYSEAPVLNDQRQRGEFSSSRSQTRTLVFEQAGDYQIPAQTFYYWDPERSALQKKKLAGFSVTIATDPTQRPVSEKNQQLIPVETIPWTMIIITSVVLLLLVVALKFRQQLRKFYRTVTRQQRRHYRRDYISACHEERYRQASEYLYQFLRTGKAHYPTLQDYFPMQPQRTYLQELFALAYDINEPNPNKKLVTRGRFARRKMLSLLHPRAMPESNNRESMEILQLNPRD
ncbi:hypothetical protein [Thalassotalea mangrovi]|uniref:hypothetical protein n=1 Tax=Thalassotalea mangrovi TaxID=2572245 RepID=UPI001FEB7D4C|nr:hypothetical protein [Thalassotalea mangrovi]